MAHPRIQRSLFTAGMATAMIALPFAGSALALGVVESTLEPVTETVDDALPAPVADAVDEAAAPIKEAVDQEAAPVVEQVVEQVLEAAPEPLREAADGVTPSKPSAGPVETQPMRPAPVPGGSFTPVQESSTPAQPAPAAGANQTSTSAGSQSLLRMGAGVASPPMTSTPFSAMAELLATDTPLTAGRDTTATAVPGSANSQGWLVATATGLLVALGAAHVAYADGRIARKATTA